MYIENVIIKKRKVFEEGNDEIQIVRVRILRFTDDIAETKEELGVICK